MNIFEKVSNTLGRIRGSYSKGLADVFHTSGAHPALTDDSAWNISPFWGAGAQSGKPRSKQQLVEQFTSWVFICARLNADARSAVPWGLYVESAPAGEKWRTVRTRAVKPARRKALAMRAELRPWITKANEGDDIEEITEHPFLELMRRPNPWTSGTDLRWITSVFMDLTGEAYWYIVKDGIGVPRQLWAIPSQYLRPIPGTSLDEFIVGYEYVRGKSNAIIPAEDVVEFKYANPLNQLGGFAPILGIVDAVYVNSKMAEFTEAMFENKARIGGVLETDSKVSAPELERFRESWKQKYAGVAKSGATVILPPGLKYQRDFVTPDEMSYIEGKRITREEICAGLGCPEALFNPGAIRANVEAAQYQHQLGAVLPWLRKMDDTLNGDFLPIYDDKIFVASEDPVVSDRVADAQVRTQYISAGVMSINDVRPELGLEPIEGGEEPLVNSMLAPLHQVVEEPEPTPSQLAPFAGANNPPKPNDNEPEEVPGADEGEAESEKLAGMVLQKLKERLFIHA